MIQLLRSDLHLNSLHSALQEIEIFFLFVVLFKTYCKNSRIKKAKMLQAQHIFLHKMVQKLFNHDYEITNDAGETLQKNASLYCRDLVKGNNSKIFNLRFFCIF